jgi:MYXO-CTERM domain-containing protein
MWTLLLTHVALATTCANYAKPTPFSVAGVPLESSGIAASRVKDGVFYTHADGGNPAEVYAFKTDGTYLGVHAVRGAANGDWEDIAAAKCPDGSDCLYIGDIGDNDVARPSIDVVLVPEPEGDSDQLKAIDVWEATYPDGPHDAEALAVQPCTGAVYIVTKVVSGHPAVYRFPPDAGHGRVVLEKVATLDQDFGAPITGMDWDRDGERLTIRTGSRIFEWTTDPSDPDAHWGTLARRVNDVDEVQGEAIGYATDDSIVTASEGTPMGGHVLKCATPTEAADVCEFDPIYEVSGCGCATSAASGPAWWIAAVVLAVRRRRM